MEARDTTYRKGEMHYCMRRSWGAKASDKLAMSNVRRNETEIRYWYFGEDSVRSR